MNGNDWSGPITVNSLPVEVRRRMAGMAMLVESARTAPNESRMIMGERYHGSPSGFPAVAETLPGGATKVTVNSLAVQRASQLIGSDADLQDKYSSLPLNQANRLRFQETFWDTVTRQRITEGPMAGKPTGYGQRSQPEWPNRDSDFPHRPGTYSFTYGPTGRKLFKDGEEARIHDGPCRQVHPGQDHSSWQDEEEEEERRHLSILAEIHDRHHFHEPTCPLAGRRKQSP